MSMSRYCLMLCPLLVACLSLGLAAQEPRDRQRDTTGAQDPRVFVRPRTVSEAVVEYAKLVREGKDALVRKHAARALEERGEAAYAVIAELRKALKSETDQPVKDAIQRAIDRIDPPLDKLSARIIEFRLRNRELAVKARKDLVKALGHERFAYDQFAQPTLRGLLLDPEVQAEAAASLESLEQHRAKKTPGRGNR